jgi:predicted transcriptional regulator
MNILRQVISILLSGEALKSSDIASRLSQNAGWPVSVRDVSAILSKISDKGRCDLAHFIIRIRQGNSYIYSIAKEASLLSEDQAYNLTSKTGDYSLQQAIGDFPGLAKYVPRPPAPRFRIVKKLVQNAAQIAPVSIRSFMDSLAKERNVELTVRYSGRSAVSLSASPKIFILICCIFLISLAMFGFLAYLFFYPVFIAGILLTMAGGFYGLVQKYRSNL